MADDQKNEVDQTLMHETPFHILRYIDVMLTDVVASGIVQLGSQPKLGELAQVINKAASARDQPDAKPPLIHVEHLRQLAVYNTDLLKSGKAQPLNLSAYQATGEWTAFCINKTRERQAERQKQQEAQEEKTKQHLVTITEEKEEKAK